MYNWRSDWWGAARRLGATMWCDVRLQLRNGFYYATAFVTLVYGLALGATGRRAANRCGPYPLVARLRA